jgi:periplasmic glucans biosynthesis protein
MGYAAVLALVLKTVPLQAQGFGFGQVRELARSLSQAPFAPSTNPLPAALRNLSYVQYQSIQFLSNKGLWASENLPFGVEFFLPGWIHSQTVDIHEVTERGVRPVHFSPDMFSFGTNHLNLPADLQYAGFRMVGRDGFGEVASFLGGSYFRMIGHGQIFGASGRGLALNTVLREKEEFPVFREFWLQKPKPGGTALTLWALLDSPSVTGAFEFEITPDVATVAQTKATLFPRIEIHQLGIAPLTSMFLYDQNSRPPWTDFRPEVHDSDGLLLHTGRGEWIWRPLESGKMMRVNAYQDSNPKGFGLMQRQRHFEQYQDLVARFELRPSAWVQPLGDWGPGSVQLVQLPTNLEYTDNIVAFWVPATAPKPGQALDLAYRIHWLTNEVSAPDLGHVLATRVGRVSDSPTNEAPRLRFVLDFGGPAVETLEPRTQLDAEVHYGESVKYIASTVQKNEINGTWRLVMEYSAPTKAVDFQGRLMFRDRPTTETWSFTWQP